MQRQSQRSEERLQNINSINSSNSSRMQMLDRSALKDMKSGIIHIPVRRSYEPYQQIREVLTSEIRQLRSRISHLAINRSTFEGKEVVIVNSEELDSLQKQLEEIDNRQSNECLVQQGIKEYAMMPSNNSSELSIPISVGASNHSSSVPGDSTENSKYIQPYDSSHDFTYAQIEHLDGVIRGLPNGAREELLNRFRNHSISEMTEGRDNESQISERVLTEKEKEDEGEYKAKYRKYKELYLKQHATAHKLRKQLNKIYEKFKN